MKKRAVFVALFYFLTCISIHAFGYELREGFLGIRWGSDISGLKGFTKISERRLVDYYRASSKVYTIDEIHIPDVIYGVFEKQFFAVYMGIESPEVFARIRNDLTSRYGDPKETFTTKNELRVSVWEDQTVKIKLKLNEKVGNMKLAFYYLPISRKLNADQEELFIEKNPKLFPIEKDSKPEYIPIFRF